MDQLNKLIEIASDEKSEASQKKKKTHPVVLSFIEECEIRQGNVFVPFYKIYNEYTNWIRRKGKKKTSDRLSNIHFGREFRQLFESKSIGSKGRGYMLNNCFKMDNLERDKRSYERKIKHNKVHKGLKKNKE